MCNQLAAGVALRLQDYIGYVICIIQNYLIVLIFALATLVFIWGMVQFFILGAGEEAKRTQGKQLMIWGILALTVMMGVWSLAKIVGRTFGLNTTLPQLKP